MKENIEKIFKQEVREKKRIGSNIFSRVSTRKGGSYFHVPYLHMSKKEQKKLSGEVRAYNMYEIISIEEFKKKSKDEQKMLFEAWREKHTNGQIIQGMGISKGSFSKWMDDLNIERKPSNLSRGISESEKIEVSEEELESMKKELCDYETFKMLPLHQQEALFNVYYGTLYKKGKQLANAWDVNPSVIYSLQYKFNQKNKKEEAKQQKSEQITIEEQPKEEIKEEEIKTPVAQLIVEQIAQEEVAVTLQEAKEEVAEEVVTIAPTLEVTKVKEVKKDSNTVDVELDGQVFNFELKGELSTKKFLKRMKFMLKMLEDEQGSFDIEIKVKQKN
ncbi:hypothetical protein [Bacillus cereus]|uniref:Uncharacterized protein n=1 Tax=Bacillus cereus HuA3-9 TaxID=1053205 RepID=R8CI42_BACCE|nr:hypothetical protein [Bacillus cereus]EOO11284.1 hypothetical protein IGA_05547 [Bacillus cereus HuA3-9]